LTLTRSFDVISFANRPLFRIGNRGRSDFLDRHELER
jgi:hypothetical protein